MRSWLSFVVASIVLASPLYVLSMDPGRYVLQVAAQDDSTSDTTPQSATGPAAAQMSASVANVIKLVQSKVSNDIILAYIENLPSLFDLTSDDLIYLDHQNIDPKFVSAMLHHDRELREQQTAALNTQNPTPAFQNVPPPPMPPAPDSTNSTNPPPTDVPYDYPSSEMSPYDDAAQSAGYFYNSLAPYGSWFALPGYGPCWQPLAACTDRHWKPYCDHGQWFFTDCGWYWNSFYPWGWAGFHYGRWLNHPSLGWLWCPGRTWAPSWVTWRDSGKNIGWAPLPPGSSFGKSGLSFQNRQVPNSFGFGLRPNDFTFVPCGDFSSLQLSSHRLNLPQTMRVFPNTWVINNFTSSSDGKILNAGLDVNLLAADTSAPILRARLKDSNFPESAGFFPSHSQSPAVVSVFRPDLLNNPQPTTRESLQAIPPPGSIFTPGLLNHPQPTTRESLQAIPPPGSIFTPGLLNHPQPTTRESLSIPPITSPAVPSAANPGATSLNPQQQNEQSHFNREPPKVFINGGPPFAPAGTRPFQPRVGMGAPHIGSGSSGGSGHP